jgi:tRNA G10  N-methylase Trm11
MKSYAAFIGHQPHISVAELAATAPGFRMGALVNQAVALFECDADLDDRWLSSLGGTVVIAERIECKSLGDVPRLLHESLQGEKGKMTFSLRTVGLTPYQVRDLYRDCKQYLKKSGIPSRYVGNDRKPAISVILRQEGLIDGSGGREICIVKTKEEMFVGVTRGAQDIDSYSKRDMEKPVRDTTVGLLPPKLAQVMVNFGAWLAGGAPPPRELPVAEPEAKKDAKPKKKAAKPAKAKAPAPKAEVPAMPAFTVFDPFCGTGVIPMECLIRGIAVMASDKSEKAMTGCMKNLEWTRKHYAVPKSEVPAMVWKQDATKPFKLPRVPNVIVTETSLGPNLRTRPTAKDAQSHRSDNEKLQADFLKNAAEHLPGVPLVCTWPVWYYSKGGMRLERIWAVVEKLGYEAVLPPGVAPNSEHASLLYRRPDQLVGREVVLLRPKK